MKREAYAKLTQRSQAYACFNALKRLGRPLKFSECTDELIERITKADLRGSDEE